MALYYYKKREPVREAVTAVQYEQNNQPLLPHLKRRFVFTFRLAPTLTSVVGITLLFSVLWPIFEYEYHSRSRANYLTETGLITPLVEGTSMALAAGPRVVSDTDYTKASNWFTAMPQFQGNSVQGPPKYYVISVPKLKIDEATVIVSSDDLSKSLIQYGGTALPGEPGSPVIFGHSILPQFFNPKNYMSIFSTLPTLNAGDDIIITYDGVVYTYRVYNKVEVYPDNVSVLEQNYDTKEIRLVTCVPPGLKTRRLVVMAKLI
jgi:sortase A